MRVRAKGEESKLRAPSPMESEVHDLGPRHAQHRRVFGSAATLALLQCGMQRRDANVSGKVGMRSNVCVDDINIEPELEKNVEKPGTLVTKDAIRAEMQAVLWNLRRQGVRNVVWIKREMKLVESVCLLDGRCICRRDTRPCKCRFYRGPVVQFEADLRNAVAVAKLLPEREGLPCERGFGGIVAFAAWENGGGTLAEGSERVRGKVVAGSHDVVSDHAHPLEAALHVVWDLHPSALSEVAHVSRVARLVMLLTVLVDPAKNSRHAAVRLLLVSISTTKADQPRVCMLESLLRRQVERADLAAAQLVLASGGTERVARLRTRFDAEQK